MKNITEVVMQLEDGTDNEVEYYVNLQVMINRGEWGLQGSFGRSMMNAIESGNCMLGTSRARDAYGNLIPARTDVQEGTKGSYEFVEARNGEVYAKLISEVQ